MCFVTNDLPKEISYCLLPRRHISNLEVHGKYSFISFSPLQRIWASLGDRWLTFASPFQRRRLLASCFGWDQQTILFALPHAEKGAAVSTGGLWVQSKGAWNHEGCKISVQLVSCLTLHAGLGQIWKHAKGIWLPLFDLHFPQAHQAADRANLDPWLLALEILGNGLRKYKVELLKTQFFLVVLL